MLRKGMSKSVFAVWLLLLSIGWCGGSQAVLAASPVVFWTSDPSRPGDTILAYGTGLADTKNIRFARLADGSPGTPVVDPVAFPDEVQALKPVQPSERSVKFILPDTIPLGVFAVELQTLQGRSAVLRLNQPEVWWSQGDAGVTATPGGWIRMFGRCLGWCGLTQGQGHNPPETTILLKGPKTIRLTAQADCYAAKAELPKDLTPGDYEMFVHNGFGGKWGWSASLKITVAAREAWPATIFDVRKLGAKGDGTSDDTEPVTLALQKAKENGGGVIYFPRGTYKLMDTLQVPPRTVLRGERQDLVHLLWPTPWNKRLDAVLLGAHQFGLENLTLTFIGANNGILANILRQGTAPLPKVQPIGVEAGDIFLRRVRMQWLQYGAGHMNIADANRILTETARDGGLGATGYLLVFGGKNIEITDCDLYSSGNVFNLVEAQGALIARNRFFIGRLGWSNFDGSDRVICEDNNFSGADNMTRAGVTFWSKFPQRNTYLARNTIENVYFFDREGFTTDGASGKYFGPVVSAKPDAVTVPTETKWKPNDLVGHTCYVLGGTGKGQWRSIVANTDATLSVDRPWDVLPSADSIIGVNHTIAHFLVVGNTMVDVGIASQFYGIAMESIIAENQSIRSSGFNSYAARYPGSSKDEKDTQPQFFVQYLDNTIVEGNSLDTVSARTYSFLRVRGFPGNGGKLEWKWPLAVGFVIRGNKLNSNAKIQVEADLGRGISGLALVEDVVVEQNVISHADVGIEISARCAGVVIRRNAFHEVLQPLTGPGLEHALVEQ